MSRTQVALMNLSEALAAPAPTADAMTKLEAAIADLAVIRKVTVPRAIFDGQLLAFAQEIVPMLHDQRYLGTGLAARWQRAIEVISTWFAETQEDPE